MVSDWRLLPPSSVIISVSVCVCKPIARPSVGPNIALSVLYSIEQTETFSACFIIIVIIIVIISNHFYCAHYNKNVCALQLSTVKAKKKPLKVKTCGK